MPSESQDQCQVRIFSIIPLSVSISLAFHLFLSLTLSLSPTVFRCLFPPLCLNYVFFFSHFLAFFPPDLQKSSLITEYGMPSSHAQFMAFFAVFFTLFMFARYEHEDVC